MSFWGGVVEGLKNNITSGIDKRLEDAKKIEDARKAVSESMSAPKVEQAAISPINSKTGEEEKPQETSLGLEYRDTDMSNQQFVDKAKQSGMSREQVIEELKKGGFSKDADIKAITDLYDGVPKEVKEDVKEEVTEKEIAETPAEKKPEIEGKADIKAIAEDTLGNADVVTDDMLDNLLKSVNEASGGIGKEEYIKEIPQNIIQMYNSGQIDKSQRNNLIANAIFTAVGNFARGFAGQGGREKSQIEKIKESTLEGGLERYNKAKENRVQNMNNVIESATNINADQKAKGLSMLQDSQIQQTMARFGEKAGLRAVEDYVENYDILKDATPDQLNAIFQIQLLQGTKTGHDILVNKGADVGLDVLEEIKEKGLRGGLSSFFSGGMK